MASRALRPAFPSGTALLLILSLAACRGGRREADEAAPRDTTTAPTVVPEDSAFKIPEILLPAVASRAPRITLPPAPPRDTMTVVPVDTATVRPSDPDVPAEVTVASDEVQAAVATYVSALSSGSAEDLASLYSPQVNFYGLGTTTRAAVQADWADVFRRYPRRRISLLGPVEVEAGGSGPIARFTYRFTVEGDEDSKQGSASPDLYFARRTGGGFLIIGERGGRF